MELQEFLQLVTPDGIRCIAMQTGQGFMQVPCRDLDECEHWTSWIDNKQKNAYFALATFKETYTNDKGKERVKRKRANVDRLKALWVDIDYKSCNPATHQGAVAALAAFLKASGFVKPTAMVTSGNGMHVYWPLSEPCDVSEWLPLAEAFKDLCQTHGLPADHACTADSARVLRPVGTHNWKDAANPKPVEWLGGSGGCYDIAELVSRLGSQSGVVRRNDGGAGAGLGDVPAHLRQHLNSQSSGTGEYTAGAGKPQNIRLVFSKCGVLRHILKTKGEHQDEPEWNATMMLLAHLDDGAKFVHKMSEGHPGYDPDVTMEKWGQKIEAVETGSGPTLCKTFESYHEDICKACPFHRSKKVKTPKSLAYMDEPAPATPAPGHATPKLVAANKFQAGQYPKNWRVGGNNDCIERKVWNEETKQYEWEPVLYQVWELLRASRNVQSDFYEIEVRNTHGASTRKFGIPAWQFGADQELRKTTSTYGCLITNQNEFKSFKDLMKTWLDELRSTNNIEDVTGQLGWIIDGDSEDQEVIGFACGTSAYYLNGDSREGVVSANSKYKGIMESFKPAGKPEPWVDAAQAIVEQGCDHLIALLASSFAAPLMRFSGQPGAVVSVVSEDSAAGKSTGLRLAQAVWGNPRHAPATMDDTQTVVKNKLAFLQNLPAFWDEVRGDEQKMHTFIQICFQVAQGRDRERANSKAETIRAEEWQTLLVACSNESLFDLAAERAAESNAGIYRILELKVPPAEYPTHDSEIMSLISQLDTNYGHAGLVYAKYLTENFDDIKEEMTSLRLTLERKLRLKGPERFWIAAITSIILGAKYAGACGLVHIDTKRLLNYLVNSMQMLRARAVTGKQRLSPRELVAAYAQQHQDGKVVVDWFPQGPGGNRQPVLQGNHSHVRKVSYVEAVDINCIMASKSDFRTWLEKSKGLKWNDKMIHDFQRDLHMSEKKCQLAAGTKFKLPRAYCLIFDLNEREEEDNAE